MRSWGERIRVAGREIDLEPALAAVRAAAERLEATQFEALTAAALVAFRAGGVEAAAIEAGLGGRHDATNVLDATRVVVLTNVSLEHTDVLGTTREAIAAEKLAVVHAGCTVVLGEPEWEDAARAAGAGEVVIAPGGSPELALEAVRAFLGRDVDRAALEHVSLPGRLERRGGEVRDGAHNPEGVRWLQEHLPPDDYTVMASILADKDVDGMLEGLAALGRRFVACRSSSPRALPAAELARRARPRFDVVEATRGSERGSRARARARRAGARDGVALPPGRPRDGRCRRGNAVKRRRGERLTVLAFAAVVLAGDRRNGVRRRVYPRKAPALIVLDHAPAPLTVFLAADSFLDSSTWNVVRNVGLFLGLVFWASTVYWVYKDARRRIEDPWLVAMATLLGRDPPVPRPVDLHALPAPGVPRGRPRARARDRGDRGAARRPRPPLPGLPGRGRRVVPRLPRLHDPSQAGL